MPAPDVVNATNGQLHWNDLTGSGVLKPNESIVIAVGFIAKASTDKEPNKQTINVAIVSGATDVNNVVVPDRQDDAPVRITNPAIGISKRTTSPANGIVALGEEVVFTIRITNKGDTTLVKIPVQDIYEANILEFVRTNISAPDRVSVQGNAGELFWDDVTTDLGDLAPGASAEFQVTFKLIAEQHTVNLVNTGTSIDENGDTVDPVTGESDANVEPAQPPKFDIFVPIVTNPSKETPTPTPTPPSGTGEEDCPPGGCPIDSLIHPKGIAVHDGQQMIYVTSRDTDTLIKFDPSTNKVVGTAPTGDEPWDVVVNENTNEIYVSMFASRSVWVYDANTLAVKAKIDVGENPALMEILPDLNTVAVVVRGINGVALIKGHSVQQYMPAGGRGAYGIAADPVNNHIMVMNRDTTNGWILYLENGSWRFSDAVELRVGNESARRSPFELAYNPNNNRLYALYISENEWFVDVFEKKSLTEVVRIATIPVGNSGTVKDPNVGGTGLAVNLKTNNVFVANTADGTVSVIGPNNQVLDTVTVGPDPYELAINPTTQYVYVTLRAGNKLAKFFDGF
ncbi:MAG: YncE family protein [Caldilineae bacterium]|nr:MAG: YncE family protein [Caldilineae bacterium]